MRDQLEKRVEELTAEYRAGERMLAEVEARRTELQHTLLRISGALQVLQELIGPAEVPNPEEPAGARPAATAG